MTKRAHGQQALATWSTAFELTEMLTRHTTELQLGSSRYPFTC